ncbi:alpha/beta hydrolase [Streptomyces sp. NPDC006430]|uniref:alpha/beta hydrolase n=1 Tax=Streptomyces sp. NPDC006430 TaxID=3154299 RepID=UPI0033AACF5B
MHRSRTGGTAGAACALVLAVLGTAPAVPASAPAPGGPRIRWGPCPERPVPDAMRCGTIGVPLDPARPAKGTITVAVAKIPATGPRGKRLGSLLLNFGGPGAPGIAGLAADSKTFAELGEHYDLVAFDPRGVGHSEPVSCGGSLETDAEAGQDAASQLAALRAVAKRCELSSGPVLPYVGTVNVSRDMDLIRQALGDRKLNYLGFSYGTRLGAVYAAQFPHKTGRMVLDGVDTLTEPLTQQALVSAQGQQHALDDFLSWCAHRTGCVYGTNTRTAREEVNDLVARLDAEPLVGQDGSYFTGQDVVGSIAGALYSTRMWPALANGLALVERDGNPLGLLQLGGPTEPSAAGTDPGTGPGTDPGTGPGTDPGTGTHALVPADNAQAALTAVNCADDPDRSADKAGPAAVEKEIAALRAQFREASEIFGPWQLMTVLSCYGRPAGTDFVRKIDDPGAPRMLLVGTRGDPATPYRWTEETAKRLGSAVVLDHKGAGHTGYGSSPCVQAYVNGFLTDGRLPSGTRSCPAAGE